jgi:hypothetical protein
MNMDKLTQPEIYSITQEFPGIPQDYLDWMRDVGWGEHENGYMVYSGPVTGDEIAPPLAEVVVVADDMAGYTIGYIRDSGNWHFVGVDTCGWEIERLGETFTQYMHG